MQYADRVKETTTTVGAGSIALAGASANYRAFSPTIATGAQVPYGVSDALGNWEIGYGTLTAPTTLARSTVLASSNAGSLVSFPAGTKDVFLTLPASMIAAFQVSQDVAFSTTIPLTVAGTQYMPQQTTVPAGFTVAASPVKGASVYVRVLGDGTTTPTFTGMKEWGGSLGWDARSRFVNEIQFFYDGYDTWYSISQAVNAVAEPTAATGVTMTGPTSGVASTASTNFSVGVTPVGGTITGTVRVTPSDASGGGTFLPTFIDLSSGAPTGTFTYTPNSTVTTRTISVTNNGGLTPPANISYSVLAAPTVPGAPTIGTATGGDASASITFTAPGSNGGSAILDYTVTASPGGATSTVSASPATVTGLTNGTGYTFTVKARNSVGSSVASAASNSVTPAAAVSAAPRFAQLTQVAESGASPNYVYTAASNVSPSSFGGYGLLTTSLPTSTDGSFTLRLSTKASEAIIGLRTISTPGPYNDVTYGIYLNGTNYQTITAGSPGGINGTALTWAATDLIRFQRVSGSVKVHVSKDSGSTWTLLHTFAAASTTQLYFGLNLGASNVVDTLSATGFA